MFSGSVFTGGMNDISTTANVIMMMSFSGVKYFGAN